MYRSGQREKNINRSSRRISTTLAKSICSLSIIFHFKHRNLILFLCYLIITFFSESIFIIDIIAAPEHGAKRLNIKEGNNGENE
jgi:hypothetical protein